jgi:hypothetical protein
VGVAVTRKADESAFLALVDPIFGAEARAGKFHQRHELQPGLFLSVEADPRTEQQVIVTIEMQPSDRDERSIIARVPMSFAYGQIFIDTVRAALARTEQVIAEDPAEGMSTWFIEHRVRSVNGGALTLEVRHEAGATTMQVRTENPSTSLATGRVNTPAFQGDPYETLAGTVYFTLTRDQFEFFSTRAYGITVGAEQNFSDFQLQPHNWLRITVTPRLADSMVDVGFDVVALDGSRIPFAKAPASFVAGEQFQRNVLRLVDNMKEQELAEPGSSMRWTAPFHYDDPAGGGVVKVIAEGEKGVFRIAYAVESPVSLLRDTEFVPYTTTVEIPDADPVQQSCADLGSEPAVEGRFRIRFDASSTVRNSDELTDPLRGPIWGSVFRAEDVTISGPHPDAKSVADFHFEDVDLTDPNELKELTVDDRVPAGEYQILGFIDIDGNALTDAGGGAPAADKGDPVTLPIGAYVMECAEQPVVVEFALLMP